MNRERLAIEKCLAIAHQAVFHATAHASTFRDLGLHDDLQMIQLELERIQEDLLRGTARRRSVLHGRAYLSSSGINDGRPST